MKEYTITYTINENEEELYEYVGLTAKSEKHAEIDFYEIFSDNCKIKNIEEI